MQKENTYHKLFRARLPVAPLPKEFADRLTKSVLDEVTRLYQANPLPLSWPGEQPDDPDPLSASSQTEESSPLKQTTITLLLLLLINIHFGLLLQGCTFYQPAASSYFSLFGEAGVDAPGTGRVDLRAPKTLAAAKVELDWDSTLAVEEPMATAIAEATATPTIYIHPWRTIVPETITTAEDETTTSTPEA